VTAKITKVDIMVRATSVTPKPEEYMTPENVFLYIKNINIPIPNARTREITMSRMDTLVMFSKKLDLKISLKLIVIVSP
jgi:hypothetical protein